MFKEHILCDVNSCEFMEHFLRPQIWSMLVSVSWALERICILLMLGRVYYKYQLYPVELFCVLADFLSRCSINCWKKSVEISDHNCELVYFSFPFYQYVLHIFCSSVIWCITFRVALCFGLLGPFIIAMSILSLLIFSSEVYFINVATTLFFWLMFI